MLFAERLKVSISADAEEGIGPSPASASPSMGLFEVRWDAIERLNAANA